MTAKPMPPHIAQQRLGGRTKRVRGGQECSEEFDVFRRIDMHDGNKEVCWEWRGAHGLGTRGEYRPRVVIAQKNYYVYRVVFKLYNGHTLGKHEVVRHTCDNSWCCNPFHMIAGTQADNVHDMMMRERSGMKMFHVKRIMQMLEIGCSANYVADKMREGYGMTLDRSVIRKIRMRTIYKHVEWPWGDEWSAKRRKRLNDIRKPRVASAT